MHSSCPQSRRRDVLLSQPGAASPSPPAIKMPNKDSANAQPYFLARGGGKEVGAWQPASGVLAGKDGSQLEKLIFFRIYHHSPAFGERMGQGVVECQDRAQGGKRGWEQGPAPSKEHAGVPCLLLSCAQQPRLQK